jgi:translation initiation factor IF-3
VLNQVVDLLRDVAVVETSAGAIVNRDLSMVLAPVKT